MKTIDSDYAALRAHTKASQTVSVRLSGPALDAWRQLKELLPDSTMSDLIDEAVRLRAVAALASSKNQRLIVEACIPSDVGEEPESMDVHDLLALSMPAKSLCQKSTFVKPGHFDRSVAKRHKKDSDLVSQEHKHR